MISLALTGNDSFRPSYSNLFDTGNHIQKGHVFDNIILDIIILPTLFAATQLFKLMDKYRPETKQAKKERLRERAAARFVVRLKNVAELLQDNPEDLLP